MAIADGTYEILSMLDVSMAVDVQGNSVANSAAVFLWSRNGDNSQKWQIANQGGFYTIRDAETDKSLDVQGAARRNGARCIMYTYSGNANQQWSITEVGEQEINGTAYPVVTIGAFAGSTYVVDVTGNKSTMRTVIEIWTANGGANQQFVLVPTEWEATASAKTSYAALPTPSLGTGGTEIGVSLPSSAALERGTYYPAWTCNQTLYQLRYRTRTRLAGADWMGEWSNWRSIADGSTAWDGFGTPGTYNCQPVDVDGVLWSAVGVPVDNSVLYDRTDIEFGVRSWTSSWGLGGAAHGMTYAFGVIAVRPVTITSLDVLLSPDGVTVAWASDGTRGGNTVMLVSDAWGTFTTTGDSTDRATVPQYLLRRMPIEGEPIHVDMTMRTTDGLAVSKSVDAIASYEGSHGTSLTLRADVHGTLATVTASDANARAWLVVARGHGMRFVPLDGDSPWTVPAPLGVPWRMLVSVAYDDSWASVVQEFSPIADNGWHVTSQDLKTDLSVYTGEGSAPKADPTYTRSVSSVEVLGRERPVYVPSDATEASWTLEGVTYGEWMRGDVNLADWAIHAGHVYFRSPQGFWAQACVTGGTVEQTRTNVRSISISMQGEVW